MHTFLPINVRHKRRARGRYIGGSMALPVTSVTCRLLSASVGRCYSEQLLRVNWWLSHAKTGCISGWLQSAGDCAVLFVCANWFVFKVRLDIRTLAFCCMISENAHCTQGQQKQLVQKLNAVSRLPNFRREKPFNCFT